MLLDLLHDLGFALLFIFIAFMVFDWSRIWWFARRHGYIQVRRGDPTFNNASRWAGSYLGFKVWTWLVRLAAWSVAAWQLAIGFCWLVQAITWASVS